MNLRISIEEIAATGNKKQKASGGLFVSGKVRDENRTATNGSKTMKPAAKKKQSMRDKKALEAKRFSNTESSMFAVAIITSSESESDSVVEEPD